MRKNFRENELLYSVFENEECRKILISSDIVCFETMYPSWRRIRQSQTAQENSDFTSLKIYSVRFYRKRELILPELLWGSCLRPSEPLVCTRSAITIAGKITTDISLARLQVGLSAAWMLRNSREKELVYSKMKNVENIDRKGGSIWRVSPRQIRDQSSNFEGTGGIDSIFRKLIFVGKRIY